MIRAHQPGSEPIDIPETIPNPVVVPKPTPTPTEPAPKEPVRIPEKVPQSGVSTADSCTAGMPFDSGAEVLGTITRKRREGGIDLGDGGGAAIQSWEHASATDRKVEAEAELRAATRATPIAHAAQALRIPGRPWTAPHARGFRPRRGRCRSRHKIE